MRRLKCELRYKGLDSVVGYLILLRGSKVASLILVIRQIHVKENVSQWDEGREEVYGWDKDRLCKTRAKNKNVTKLKPLSLMESVEKVEEYEEYYTW